MEIEQLLMQSLQLLGLGYGRCIYNPGSTDRDYYHSVPKIVPEEVTTPPGMTQSSVDNNHIAAISAAIHLHKKKQVAEYVKAIVDYRPGVTRCLAIVTGHAGAHRGHASNRRENSTRLDSGHSKPGAAPLLIPVFASSVKTPGNVCASLRRRCPIPRCKCCCADKTRSDIATTPDDVIEKFVERCAENGHGRFPHLRCDERHA